MHNVISVAHVTTRVRNVCVPGFGTTDLRQPVLPATCWPQVHMLKYSIVVRTCEQYHH